MRAVLYAWQLLSVILAGMLNEHQQQIIEYFKAENQVVCQQVGDRRSDSPTISEDDLLCSAR